MGDVIKFPVFYPGPPAGFGHSSPGGMALERALDAVGYHRIHGLGDMILMRLWMFDGLRLVPIDEPPKPDAGDA